ncbi:MAG: hypothetical protein ACOCRO_07430 [Halanaerobiales bacterium]
MKSALPDSKLIISEGIAVFIGNISDTDIHKHHAIQITFDIDDFFGIKLNNRSFKSKAMIINSGVEHTLIGSIGMQVLMLIEPESIYGESIGKIIKKDGCFLNWTMFLPINIIMNLKL